MEEIRLAVFSLPSDSAPGCDGYHAHFFQRNWLLVQNDLFSAVQGFWNSEFLLTAYNKTVITLIPKVDKPSSLQNIRPISLCNVIYKIISKVLANRLKPILQKIIAPTQSAFLQGRLISDNIILAGELMNQIHTSRQGRKKLAALKVDFAKAFDRLSWDFIAATLERMKFPDKWISLIYQCISTVQYQIQVNGYLSQPINPSRGIRQGDPLSPYLYILAANVLSSLIAHIERAG